MSARRLVLDAGALIAVERDPRGQVLALCRAVLREGQQPLLPAVVYGQVWRASPRQHPVGVLRRMCQVLPFTEQTAEDVGRLLARSGSSDVVDAAVVVAAIEWGAVVLTSDPEDIGVLADAAGYRVPVLTL